MAAKIDSLQMQKGKKEMKGKIKENLLFNQIFKKFPQKS